MEAFDGQVIVDWQQSYWTRKLQCTDGLVLRPASLAETIQGLCHSLVVAPARSCCQLGFPHPVSLPIGPLLAWLKQKNKLNCVQTDLQRQATEIAIRTLLRDCSGQACVPKRQLRLNQAVCTAVADILIAMDKQYEGLETLISPEKDVPKARAPDPLGTILKTLETAYSCVPRGAVMPEVLVV